MQKQTNLIQIIAELHRLICQPNQIYLFTEHYYTLEEAGKNFERLAMLEELKTMPFGGVWDYYCLLESVPTGMDYIDEIQQYEKEVLSRR